MALTEMIKIDGIFLNNSKYELKVVKIKDRNQSKNCVKI